jgi:UDPglucose 6-dehydrogenase
MKFPSISIVGTGYVGLCTAVGFATRNHKVISSTHDEKKALSINTGTPPFFEPNLEKLLRKAVFTGCLECMVGREKAVLNTDVTFIAVGTPSKPDGNVNLNYIRKAAQEIGESLAKKEQYHLVVVKSTVIPGTTQNVVKPILQKHSGKKCGRDFGLCMNPEFLREGSAIEDTLHPDKIVIGEHDETSGDFLQSLYEDFYKGDVPPVLRTNLATAELVKYANNAFLATKISFINEIANICQQTPGTDVTVVAKTLGLDHRINPSFLRAGLGYGGSCLPKDVRALIAHSKSNGYNPSLLQAVEETNLKQPYRAVGLSKKFLGDLKDKQIAVLGLSFKPGTDDMREAVSTRLIERLLEEGAKVTAYDPAATLNSEEKLSNRIEYVESPIQCIREADCCIIVTEWREFEKLTPDDFISNMKRPIIIDGRGIFNPELFRKRIVYSAIGLGEI